VGKRTPEGQRIGYADAIIQNGLGNAAGKIDALKSGGVCVVDGSRDIPILLKEVVL